MIPRELENLRRFIIGGRHFNNLGYAHSIVLMEKGKMTELLDKGSRGKCKGGK